MLSIFKNLFELSGTQCMPYLNLLSLLAVFRYDSLFVSTKSPITPIKTYFRTG